MDSTFKEIQPHPNPIPSDHHRKIELQSHADLTYLQQNLAKAAREKLDLHFPSIHSSTKSAPPATIISLDGTSSHPPPEEQDNHNKPENNSTVEEDEDPLRTRVRHLIDQFLQNTHTAAKPSISVNGIDATSLSASSLPSCSNPTPTNPDPNALNSSPLTPTHEIEGIHYTHTPFDPRLQKALSTLHADLELLTAQVSKLRREAPQSAARSYTTNLTAATAADEQNWLTEQTRLQNEVHAGLDLAQMRHGWNEDVKEMYNRGTSQLAVLSGATAGGNRDEVERGDGMESMISLTETVGRVQRARNVAAEFE